MVREQQEALRDLSARLALSEKKAARFEDDARFGDGDDDDDDASERAPPVPDAPLEDALEQLDASLPPGPSLEALSASRGASAARNDQRRRRRAALTRRREAP